jgi:KDO2-lipid IV(A) lauroyltransferase
MAEPLRRKIRAQLLDGASVAAALTPQPLLRAGLRGASWLSRFSSLEKRTRANLQLAYGSELSSTELKSIADGVRQHTARLAEEWLTMAAGQADLPNWIQQQVEIDPSIQILRDEMEKGRGVIVATGHLGNWELLAATLKLAGFDGAVVGLTKHRDSSAAWLQQLRRNYGVETIPQHANPRDLMRVLQRGELLGLLCDLEVRRLAGEHIPFFGRPALTMTAPAALARARRLPLVPVRCVLPYPGAQRYLLSVEPPLHLNPKVPRQEAAIELLTELNGLFESWIRETPSQWAWHQSRWRSAPADGQSVPLGAR